MSESTAVTCTEFSEMALSKTALHALERAEYRLPTPIQSGFIPLALQGGDVCGQAQTGTGKTAAFLLPVLEHLEAGAKGAAPLAIALVPTRELATQVSLEAIKLSRGRSIRVIVLCGGKPMRPQINQLQAGVDLVVGTPGLIHDHVQRGNLSLASIKFAILDEADRMLDIGFRPDIERILGKCPRKRQTLLLSATMPDSVMRLANRYMNDPESINFSPENVSVETIDLFYVTVEAPQKFDLLVSLLKKENPQQSIVFCRTKRKTDQVAQRLKKRFQDVSAIHGDLPQNTRDRVMQNFRDGKIRCLVATDVIGRGIDV
ncbi:MAG: DEAD/DEAH box helicase, partial [Planctomycetales bacterium]